MGSKVNITLSLCNSKRYEALKFAPFFYLSTKWR